MFKNLKSLFVVDEEGSAKESTETKESATKKSTAPSTSSQR